MHTYNVHLYIGCHASDTLTCTSMYTYNLCTLHMFDHVHTMDAVHILWHAVCIYASVQCIHDGAFWWLPASTNHTWRLAAPPLHVNTDGATTNYRRRLAAPPPPTQMTLCKATTNHTAPFGATTNHRRCLPAPPPTTDGALQRHHQPKTAPCVATTSHPWAHCVVASTSHRQRALRRH